MKLNIRSIVTVAVLVAMGWMAPGAALAKKPRAEHGHAQQQQRDQVAQGGLSLDAAVQMVQQRFNARVVRAETRQEKGRTVYVLRLLNEDGKVWTVHVDADSGAVL